MLLPQASVNATLLSPREACARDRNHSIFLCRVSRKAVAMHARVYRVFCGFVCQFPLPSRQS